MKIGYIAHFAVAAVALFIAAPAAAQTVCTYTEAQGTVKNCIGTQNVGGGPAGASASQVQGTAANGAAPVGNPEVVAGVGPDGFVHRVATANDGTVYVYVDGVVDGAVRSDSASSAAVGASFSTAGFNSISFQIVANASSNTFLIEGSNDGGTTWSAIGTRFAAFVGTLGGSPGATGNNQPSGTVIPTYVQPLMRWRISTYVAGTTTVATAMKRNMATNAVDAFVGGGTLTAVATKGSVGDGSGSVTTGGTSQVVFGTSSTRSFLRCQNPSVALSGVAAESLFINYTTAASTTAVNSEELVNGASVTFDGTAIPTSAINITAATTGHKFVCKQF